MLCTKFGYNLSQTCEKITDGRTTTDNGGLEKLTKTFRWAKKKLSLVNC